MNLYELVAQVSTSTGMPDKGVKTVIDALIETLRTTAAKGEDVAIPGFGQFKVKDSPARTGRNPATGEAMEIAASRKLTFTPAKAVKDALKG